MNKFDRYRMELVRLSNNIRFYKQKIAMCQATDARIYYEKLLAKEAKRFQDLQIEYRLRDLRSWEVTNQDMESEEAVDSGEFNQEDLPMEEELTQEPLESDQQSQVESSNGQRIFTIEELSMYNGMNGQPAYVAVNGIVYDVSSVQRWAGGRHYSMVAGKNLTMNFNTCHAGNLEQLKNVPKVGVLKQ